MQAPKVVRLDPMTVIDRSDEPPPLGPVVIQLPETAVLCHDAFSCTLITGERPASGERFMVIVSAASIEGEPVGTLAQFTPDQARSFAASMLASADQLDGGQRGAH